MSERLQAPKRLVRAMNEKPQIDHEKRTIIAEFITRKLARDGGIVVPEGIVKRFFEENPIVLARHGLDFDSRSPVIARSLGLEPTRLGMQSTTQFAETDLGLEYAYLYGVNEKEEVYMRAWSFGWSTLAMEIWTIESAKKWLGDDWDEDAVPPDVRRHDEVWVAVKSEMHEYSAVPVGADRAALSRALDAGIKTAGTVITIMDLEEARAELARINKEIAVKEVRNLTMQIQALSRDGAAAAERGDSAALLAEVRELAKMA